MIEFGKEYKYKELCKALEVEPKRGGYQKNQMSQLSERYDIEKLPNKKYVVHKEYTMAQISFMSAGQNSRYNHVFVDICLRSQCTG